MTMKIWDAINVNVSRTRILLRNTDKFSNHEFLLEQLSNYLGGRNLTQTQSRGHMICKVMRKGRAKILRAGQHND